MKVLWVLVVLLHGTEISEEIYTNDLDGCITLSHKLQSQNTHQRRAGDTVYLKAYCIPKKVD